MRFPLLAPTLTALIAGTGQPSLRAQEPVAVIENTPLPILTYRGHLMKNGTPANGFREFQFSILDSARRTLWDSSPQNLTVEGGRYTVILGTGAMPPIPSSLVDKIGLKLHVTVAGNPLAPDVPILPSLQILPSWGFLDGLLGDVTGTPSQNLVSKLQGFPLDFTHPPRTGQALTFNGNSWAPSWELGPQGPVGPQGPEGPLYTTMELRPGPPSRAPPAGNHCSPPPTPCSGSPAPRPYPWPSVLLSVSRQTHLTDPVANLCGPGSYTTWRDSIGKFLTAFNTLHIFSLSLQGGVYDQLYC